MIVDGSSLLDESSLTGEARPVKKCTNDSVSGGTINVGASPLLVRSTSTVENSAIARLIQLVEEAQTNQSQTEKIVDAFAKRFTPIVISAAVFMCTIPWLISAEEGHKWAYNGVVTIVIACPCAMLVTLHCMPVHALPCPFMPCHGRSSWRAMCVPVLACPVVSFPALACH